MMNPRKNLFCLQKLVKLDPANQTLACHIAPRPPGLQHPASERYLRITPTFSCLNFFLRSTPLTPPHRLAAANGCLFFPSSYRCHQRLRGGTRRLSFFPPISAAPQQVQPVTPLFQAGVQPPSLPFQPGVMMTRRTSRPPQNCQPTTSQG